MYKNKSGHFYMATKYSSNLSSEIKVAGSIILYNSTLNCLDNIKTYINQITILYVIDNSDIENTLLIEELKNISNIVYISNNGNKGVGYALNIVATLAFENGFDYLLTMDDDSQAPFNLVYGMVDKLNQLYQPERIGIISVAHSKTLFKRPYKYVWYTMTSGNLLNLHIYKKVGPFEENFFIDHIDHEYALRLRIHNYKIIELTNLKLGHNLGIIKKIKIANQSIVFISHSPNRLYYLVRNGVYIIRKYFFQQPIFCLMICILNVKESIKSMILEDQKKIRLSYFFKAMKDGWSGKLGKI